MDEKVVFNPQQPNQSTPQQPLQAQPQSVSQPPAQPPPATPPPPIKRPFLSKSLILGIVGVVVVLLLIVFIFRFLLAVLGGNKNEKVTLTYWGLWEDSRVMFLR